MFLNNILINSKLNQKLCTKNNIKGSNNNLFVFTSSKNDSNIHTHLPKSNSMGRSIVCFKKMLNFNELIYLPNPLFYKNYNKLPVVNSVHMFIYYGCSKSLELILKRFFWNTKITDHRYILL